MLKDFIKIKELVILIGIKYQVLFPEMVPGTIFSGKAKPDPHVLNVPAWCPLNGAAGGFKNERSGDLCHFNREG